MNNVVFTIVAKNYLPFARTLGDSIFKIHNNDIDYFIYLVDEAEGFIDFERERYNIIESSSIGIVGFLNMAFRYDIKEFSTSLKPYIINHLFEQGYDKVIYLDPDVSVYNPLSAIFKELDKYSLVLTPHMNHPVKINNNATDEEFLLFTGIYNLGFVAMKKDEHIQSLLEWWMKKLYDSCFDERTRALFVDQKWMSFSTAFLGENVLISRNPGYNMAVWNLHERSLKKVNNNFQIIDKTGYFAPLIFYHFSGYNPIDKDIISCKHPSASFEIYPELKELFDNYRDRLLLNGAPDDFNKTYKYSYFENGGSIIKIQRRLFNSLLLSGVVFTNPFSVNKGSFYELLEKNRLLLKSNGFDPEKIGIEQIGKFSNKIRILYYFMRLFQRFLGVDRYALLLRFLFKNASYDSQLFIIKKK
ncbi:MAG: hypothetical protein NTV87_15820 [Ignavibacteriae bacterium]|nr:hypothetical protein [Ignavibacteriota bacterium]